MLTEGKKGINKKLILLIITNVISFYIIFRLNIFMVNNVDLAELTIVKDIKGINYIIGFISVFCCFYIIIYTKKIIFYVFTNLSIYLFRIFNS